MEKELFEDEEKELKEKLIDNPNRLNYIWELLDKLIVGEEFNKKVLFLIMASALLKTTENQNALGAYLSGSSSSGKTHLARECSKLFPQEMKMIYGGASPKSLIYGEGILEPDERFGKDEKGEWKRYKKIIDLDHKILWFLEDTGNEKTLEIIRPILSKDQKEINFQVTVKGKSKEGERFENQEVTVRGCPAFITTSTKSNILSETGTRVFHISPDESEHQTRKIMAQKIDKRRMPYVEPPLKLIHSFLRTIPNKEVLILMSDLVALPSFNVAIRRNIDKIMNLIATITLLNHKERREIMFGGRKVLLATINDFILAMNLVTPILQPTLMNLPKKLDDFLIWMEEKRKDEPNFVFTHASIAKSSKYSQTSARKYCWNLMELGYLIGDREGRENVYEILKKREIDDSNIYNSIYYTGKRSVTSVTENTATPNSLWDSISIARILLSVTVIEKYNKGEVLSILKDVYSLDYSNSVTLKLDWYQEALKQALKGQTKCDPDDKKNSGNTSSTDGEFGISSVTEKCDFARSHQSHLAKHNTHWNIYIREQGLSNSDSISLLENIDKNEEFMKYILENRGVNMEVCPKCLMVHDGSKNSILNCEKVYKNATRK